MNIIKTFLEKLVSNSDNPRFKHISKYFKDSEGTYPYEHVADANYEYAQTVFNPFSCKSLSDHTEFYCESDAVLLNDVFESFIDVCLEKYKVYCKVQKANLSWSSLVCYKIQTEDFYEDIKADMSTRFYTSKYPKDHASNTLVRVVLPLA